MQTTVYGADMLAWYIQKHINRRFRKMEDRKTPIYKTIQMLMSTTLLELQIFPSD